MPTFFAMTDCTILTTALMSIGLAFLVVLIYREERRRARAVRMACRRLLARADLHCSDPEPDGSEPRESTLEENV
jgi:hypothetical protein